MPSPLRRVVTVMAAAALVVAGAAGTSSAGQSGPVGTANNDLNWTGSSAYPAADTGGRMLRLWDSNTLWRQIEPSANSYNWTRLDTLEKQIYDNGSQPLVVLAGTPTWAAAGPAEDPNQGTSSLGQDGNRIPDMTAWRSFVRAVAQRNVDLYPGKAHAYEIWNEGNLPQYYNGSPQDMAALVSAAWYEVKVVDKYATVVGPSVGGRQGTALSWFGSYLDAGGTIADAQAVSMYPRSGGTPESALWDIERPLRDAMDARGLTYQPLWDTEINYYLDRDGVAIPHGGEGRVAAGYVARTYMLAPWNRVDRTFWYSWDSRSFGGIYLVQSDRQTLALPGIAYREVTRWMTGATETQCGRASFNRNIVYCRFTYARGGQSIAAWVENGFADWSVPDFGQRILRLDGSSELTAPGTYVQLTQNPVLVESLPGVV